MTPLDISPPEPKKACRFSEWFPEHWPNGDVKGMLFRCLATGYVSKPGGKKDKGVDVKARCNTCILYQPKGGDAPKARQLRTSAEDSQAAEKRGEEKP